MKSSIKKSTWKAVYRLLDRVSPMPFDCGSLCGSACCTCDETPVSEDDFEMGIYLLPGEEKIFTMKEDWLVWKKERASEYEFPDSWNGNVYFVRCKTPPICPRNMRPLQCRFYPVMPFISEDGHLYLIRHAIYTPYICPLTNSEYTLERRFLKATYTVWKRLLKDPLIYDLVTMDSEFLMEEKTSLDVVFDGLNFSSYTLQLPEYP